MVLLLNTLQVDQEGVTGRQLWRDLKRQLLVKGLHMGHGMRWCTRMGVWDIGHEAKGTSITMRSEALTPLTRPMAKILLPSRTTGVQFAVSFEEALRRLVSAGVPKQAQQVILVSKVMCWRMVRTYRYGVWKVGRRRCERRLQKFLFYQYAMPKLKDPPVVLDPWLVEVKRLLLDATADHDEMAFAKSLEAGHLVMSHMGSDPKPMSTAPHDCSVFFSKWSALLQEWHESGCRRDNSDTVGLVAEAVVLTANKVTHALSVPAHGCPQMFSCVFR